MIGSLGPRGRRPGSRGRRASVDRRRSSVWHSRLRRRPPLVVLRPPPGACVSPRPARRPLSRHRRRQVGNDPAGRIRCGEASGRGFGDPGPGHRHVGQLESSRTDTVPGACRVHRPGRRARRRAVDHDRAPRPRVCGISRLARRAPSRATSPSSARRCSSSRTTASTDASCGRPTGHPGHQAGQGHPTRRQGLVTGQPDAVPRQAVPCRERRHPRR